MSITRWGRRVAAIAGVFAAILLCGRARATSPPLETQDAAQTGSLPKGVSLSPDGTRLYVTNYGLADRKNLAVYDAATLKLLEPIDVPGIVVETTVSPDGHTLYASNFRRNSVQFIDVASRRVVREVRAGMHPKILVVSHDGRRLFVANWGNETVTELDAASGHTVRTLHVEKNPRGMAFTRAGRLFVANFTSDSLDVFDGPNMDRVRRVRDVCRVPRHLALSPDENHLYISCLYKNELLVLDTHSLETLRRVPIGKGPKAIDVSHDGRYVVSADYRGSSVTVVDTRDWSTRIVPVPGMVAASGVAIAATPARAPHADSQVPKTRAAGLRGDSGAKRLDAKAIPERVRIYVTGWYDNHLYQIGIAGTHTRYEVDREAEDDAIRRRAYFRKHPVE